MSEETVGERIRRLRMERGMSLAKVVGGDFSRAFLNQVELGRSQPSTRVLRVIAARLGTHVEYLLDGSTPTLDREVALERARISLARSNYRRSLAELEPALETRDWPLGADARLTAAEALLGLGRRREALEILAAEDDVVRGRGDSIRLKRLRALRSGRRFRAAPVGDVRELGEFYARLGDKLLRSGRSSAALEQYHVARTLLDAARQLDGPPTRPPETGRAKASPAEAGSRA